VPSLVAAIGFFCSEVIALTAFLALGIFLYAAVAPDAVATGSSILSIHELLRALGASVVFMILSGYLVSIAILLVIFRNRVLSLTHAGLITLLFVLHAGFFLFYLRGPVVVSSSTLAVAVGVVCVIAAAATQYLFWRRWL
jgi:hypothetical protein